VLLMAYDRKDHVRSLSERQHERAAAVMPLVRLVAGAAPLMETLTTRDEHWNRYLQYLQGIMERFEQSRDVAHAKLADPSTWKTEDLLKLKSDALVAQATIDALKLAIELPSAIMGGKDEAGRIIKEFEQRAQGKDESAGPPQS
jgi:hypothetical protein